MKINSWKPTRYITHFCVNEDSKNISTDTNKQPTFSMETGGYIRGRPEKQDRKHRREIIIEVSRAGVVSRSSSSKSVTVEEKTLVVQEGME
jgi:hypothetical protein